MPLFMDRHDIPGVSAEDVADAHQKDLSIQEEFDCRALTYWFDEEAGMAFCLIEAPNKEAVQRLHNYAHGLIPNEIIEVEPNLVASFLGRIKDPVSPGNSFSVINDPAFRCIVAVYIPAAFYSDGCKKRKEYNYPIRKEFRRHSGKEVIMDREYLMASFPSVFDSVRCALSIQRSVFFPGSEGGSPQIGMAAGVPVSGNKDFFGPTITLVKRLCLIAKPGRIVASHLMGEKMATQPMDTQEEREFTMHVLSRNQEEFFTRVMEILENNLDDSDFDVRRFAEETGMSKSKLYRNMKAITGFSPVDFIKEFRMKMAVRFISKQQGNLSEIAYELGFTSLSYFSKCFQERFGIPPSMYSNSIT